MAAPARMVSIGLLGLAAALTAVGLASGTVLRHSIQIIPALAALIVIARRPTWGAYAALPIFALWIVIVALIWAFLLGLARIVTGQFSTVEIIGTVFMAGFSAIGIVNAISLGRPFRPRLLVGLVAFAALQIVALQISFLPGIAER